MEISVIVPTRNRSDFLKEAVASVQSQTRKSWELIVVDDASTDGTSDWLRALHDPRVRTVRLPVHRERSAARNLGLESATGEWIVFLDDDDRLKPDALDCLTAGVTRYPNSIAVVGAREFFAAGRGTIGRSQHSRRSMFGIIWPDVLAGWSPIYGQTLVRKDAVVRAGGFDEKRSLAEDHDLWLRLAILGPVLILPMVVLEQREHAGQTPQIGARRISLAIRRPFVERLPPRDRPRGARVLGAQRCIAAGEVAFQRRNYKLSLALFSGAIRRAPFLLRSPLIGRRLIALFLKSLAGRIMGGYSLALARRLKGTRKSPA